MKIIQFLDTDKVYGNCIFQTRPLEVSRPCIVKSPFMALQNLSEIWYFQLSSEKL